MNATLIACAHGTRSPEGRATIRRLVDQVRTLLPDVRVEEAFVDVHEPYIDDVAARVAPDGVGVVVPVLLSTGFHTKVDIARAVDAHPQMVATPALGPHDLLALVLESRLADAQVSADDAIVLAAAGSSDPAAATDVARMAGTLARCVFAPVTVGFAAGHGTRIAAAVDAARHAGARRVIAASYVLAPGHFANVIAQCGADSVTSPLAPDVRIAAIVVERYRAAVAALRAEAATR